MYHVSWYHNHLKVEMCTDFLVDLDSPVPVEAMDADEMCIPPTPIGSRQNLPTQCMTRGFCRSAAEGTRAPDAEVTADECGTITDTDIASTWLSEYERRAYVYIV